MTDREKLIELLNEASEILLETAGGLNDNHGNGIRAYHLIANGVVISNLETTTMQQWIPASEPPKEPGEYDVVQKHWLDGHLESKRGKWNGVEWFVDGKESLMVTHWMPLPQPPKGE